MRIDEYVPLSTLTTLRVGGAARYVCHIESLKDLTDACEFAEAHALPIIPLGEGSNVLAPDEGLAAVILLMKLPGAIYEDMGTHVRVRASAGLSWDTFVSACAERSVWGIENLAGIPGTVGAAPVQNIGAYGASVSDSIECVEAYDVQTKESIRIPHDACRFGYRQSRFKNEKNLIITAVTFLLSKQGTPELHYPDFAPFKDTCAQTPRAVTSLVREIRAKKFPDLTQFGTAGSFFKNPIVSREVYERLVERYEGLPGFAEGDAVKIPVAWILDRVLHLRGYTEGNVLLFQNQPLVLVTQNGATADAVKKFAEVIAEKVFAVSEIKISPEVQFLK